MSIKLTIEITGETSEEVEAQLNGLQFSASGGAGETLDAQVEGGKPKRGRKQAAAPLAVVPAQPAAAAAPAPIPGVELDFTKDILPHAQQLAKSKGLKAAQELAVKHGASAADPRASQVPKSAHHAYLADLKAALEEPKAAPAASTADLV